MSDWRSRKGSYPTEQEMSTWVAGSACASCGLQPKHRYLGHGLQWQVEVSYTGCACPESRCRGPRKVVSSFTGQHDFLSNFHFASCELDGQDYATVEHAFQAAKEPEGSKHRAMCRQVHTPTDAKRLGRRCRLRPDWEGVKEGIMLDLLRSKFMRSPLLEKLLSETGDAILVEGNWWGDDHWGVCDPARGLNRLGVLLMLVRDEILNDFKEMLR